MSEISKIRCKITNECHNIKDASAREDIDTIKNDINNIKNNIANIEAGQVDGYVTEAEAEKFALKNEMNKYVLHETFQQSQASITDALNTIHSESNANTQAINDIEAEINTLNNDFDALESNVNTYDSRISTLNTENNAAHSELLQSIENERTMRQSNDNAINNTLSQHATKLEQVEFFTESVNQCITDINNLSTTVETNTADIATLKEQGAGGGDTSAIENDITEIKNSINISKTSEIVGFLPQITSSASIGGVFSDKTLKIELGDTGFKTVTEYTRITVNLKNPLNYSTYHVFLYNVTTTEANMKHMFKVSTMNTSSFTIDISPDLTTATSVSIKIYYMVIAVE